MMKIVLTVFVFSAGVILSANSYAATQTTILDISANVVPACSVSSSGVNFGDFSGDVKTANGNIYITCVSDTIYSIGLSVGQNGAGTRRLSDGINEIDYYLYQDSGYSIEWGDPPVFPPQAMTGLTGNGTEQSYTVYGRIPTQSVITTGDYTDTVIVSVYY